MAMEYQGFATLGVNLNRQKYGPLDVSSVFTSTADLTYYITKGQTVLDGLSDYWKDIVPYPYEGQLVSLAENGEVYVLKLVAKGDIFEAIDIGGEEEEYVPIVVSGMNSTPNYVEIGTAVGEVSLTWKLNKTPTTQTLKINNGMPITLDVNDREWKKTNVNITETTGYTLSVTDVDGDNSSSSEQTVYVTFCNGIYYGVMQDGATVNLINIEQNVGNKKLTKILRDKHGITTFTVTPANDERLFYAAPSSYGEPSFVINNLEYEWIKTEATLNQVRYNIWQSGQAGLGTTSVTVTNKKEV